MYEREVQCHIMRVAFYDADTLRSNRHSWVQEYIASSSGSELLSNSKPLMEPSFREQYINQQLEAKMRWRNTIEKIGRNRS